MMKDINILYNFIFPAVTKRNDQKVRRRNEKTAIGKAAWIPVVAEMPVSTGNLNRWTLNRNCFRTDFLANY